MSEPTCDHVPTCRVSHPVNMGLASVYCCDRPTCREAAQAWVKETTGAQAEIVALPRKLGRRT